MPAGDPDELIDAPGPRPLPRDPSLLSQFRLSLSNPIEAWPRAVYEQRVFKPPVPGLPVFVMDPALIHAVLVENSASFSQGELFRRLLRPIWGRGLATADSAEWWWQRRAAAPAFRPAELSALAPRMRSAAEAALARWREAGPAAVHDIAEEAATITFDIILDSILSGGEDLERGTARRRIGAFVAQLAPMRVSYFLAPDSFHRGRGETQSAEARELRADVARMIRRRRRAPLRGDLVDLLLGAKDPETGREMDDDLLADNLLGFIVAGHETSAVGLAWALYLLSRDSRSADRVRSEVAEVTGGRPVGAEHVERLVFTRQVVQESLRLYPPGHSLIRVCTSRTRIGDLTVRRGGRVVIPIYALHRHRLLWRDPDRFDPDRFGPSEPQPERYAYLPFGAGPRVCIGAALAMMELVVTLATLVRYAGFTLQPGHRVWPIAELALRPEGGLPMQVHLDSAGAAAA